MAFRRAGRGGVFFFDGSEEPVTFVNEVRENLEGKSSWNFYHRLRCWTIVFV